MTRCNAYANFLFQIKKKSFIVHAVASCIGQLIYLTTVSKSFTLDKVSALKTVLMTTVILNCISTKPIKVVSKYKCYATNHLHHMHKRSFYSHRFFSGFFGLTRKGSFC